MGGPIVCVVLIDFDAGLEHFSRRSDRIADILTRMLHKKSANFGMTNQAAFLKASRNIKISRWTDSFPLRVRVSCFWGDVNRPAL